MKNVIGIDPGNKETAVCIYNGTRIMYCDKIDNETIVSRLSKQWTEASAVGDLAPPDIFIEDIQAMGMAVGQEVFDTAKMIGRMQQTLENRGTEYNMVKRTEIKLHHCNTTRAKDTNIRQALIDRFGDKGTKKEPGFFFGISGNDQWSACAIAIYGHDKLNGR